jgi:hypothetical protein
MAYVGQNNVTGHIEVGVVADLNTGTLAAGAQWIGKTAHVLSDNSLWQCVINPVGGQHVWLQIATAAAVLLPDQRFTVGSAAYNLLNPGISTLLTVATGIAAAAAGTSTALGPASATSQRLVELEPDSYDEDVALSPFVHLKGMGEGTGATRVFSGGAARTVSYTSGPGYVVVRDLEFDGVDINLSPTAGPTTIVFENVQFTNCDIVLGAAAGTQFSLKFINCTGAGNTISSTQLGGTSITVDVVGASTLDDVLGPSGFQFTASPAFAGLISDNFVLRITQGARWLVGVGSAATFSGLGAVFIETSDALVATGGPPGTVSVWSSVGVNQLTWNALSGTQLNTTPRSYFDTDSAASFTGGEVLILQPSIVAGAVPLDPVSGGTVQSAPIPSNRQRRTQVMQFVVPAAGASVAAQTVNGVAASDAWADEIRLQATYQPGFAIQPDTAILGTFQFATFQLIDPLFYEQGRDLVFKNVGNPNGTNDGPVALRLPNASASRVDNVQPDVAVNTVITSLNYYILAPGDEIRFSVDRDNVVVPQYRMIG